MKRSIRMAAVFALVSLCPYTGARAEIVTIEIPGAKRVIPTAINDKGQVTGYCDCKGSGYLGFIWRPNGDVVTFGVSGATIPAAISAAGVVTGYYYAGRTPLGFVRAADGTITTFTAPHGHLTQPVAGNRKGWSVGNYRNGKIPGKLLFLRAPSGEMTEFAVPGANGDEYVAAVNRSRTVAGVGRIRGGTGGFIRSADGTLTMFGDTSIDVAGMNDAGTITGPVWVGEVRDSYVRTSDGTITTFSAPNSTNTQALAINNSGTIVGTFFLESETSWQGFIRTDDGTFTPIDPDGSGDVWVAAINNKGVFAGAYLGSDGLQHGFIGTP